MPGRTFFISALFYLALGCFAFFISGIFVIWILTGVLLIPFIITDLLLLLLLTERLQIKRTVPSSAAQGEALKVLLLIRRKDRFLPFSIRLYDLYPDSMSCLNNAQVFPAKLDRKNLRKTGTVVFEYSLMPEERGAWFFSGTQVMLGSFLRFWRLRVTHENISAGRTYPNFKKMARGVNIKGNPEKGEVKQIRKRGHGLEFESLRDYMEGDSMRSIDWRATSRNRRLDGKPKLIVRNYQEEQDQQILFIIDSGYRLPDYQFDSALEAMLLLSYTALKHGDAVAAASFGAHDIWIPPRKGIRAYMSLMNTLYDLHSAPVPSSPFSAMEKALSRLHRRSLIVLISNFREEDGESLSWILPRINRRHLLLMVSFQETALYELASGAGRQGGHSFRAGFADENEILETAAARSYLVNRRRLYRKWEHSGLLVLETSPEHISSALINKYLSVKKSGKL
ncbi:MAG: DUF58 domain-containing protein [Treponema sp.]|nr:DUF58 domain-containing protein [Treponema sp.]MCL2266683.1 DUF58 domain-containing protein [Treponema sp.]